jgi:hypothetical protein
MFSMRWMKILCFLFLISHVSISAQMIETFATFMCQQCTNFQLEESMSTDLDLISK